MFTGLVSDVGRVAAVEGAGDLRLRVETGWDTGAVDLGASVACSGVCLTVAGKGDGWLEFDVSAATLEATTLGGWKVGRAVNLERSLKVGDELGGHIVSGHVDGAGRIAELEDAGESKRMVVAAPAALMPYIAVKGSVAVDGVSLTVNALGEGDFEFNLVPHTVAHTAFGEAGVGDGVNLEVDILARYLDRLASFRGEGSA